MFRRTNAVIADSQPTFRSDAMITDSQPTFRFDEKHIPHVALANAFVWDYNLYESGLLCGLLTFFFCLTSISRKRLQEIVWDNLRGEPLSVHVTGCYSSVTYFSFFGPVEIGYTVEPTPVLNALHKDVLAAVSLDPPPVEALRYSFPPCKWHITRSGLPPKNVNMDDSTLLYVRDFAKKHAMDNYFPRMPTFIHDSLISRWTDITLGMSNEEVAHKLQADHDLQKQFSFQVPRIAVCRMGSMCTCCEVLFDVPLVVTNNRSKL